MDSSHPYCGPPPLPGEALLRWNFDPWLIGVWGMLAGLALWMARHERLSARRRGAFAAGWGLALAAWISPLCALGVALFSARVGQHMLLALVAAPLVAWSWPARARSGAVPSALWAWLAFTAASWLWHAPGPYRATFESDALYWAMHATLFLSALAVWRLLLADAHRFALAPALALGSCFQMSALGALLTFAPTPLFTPHLHTTAAFGLSPLEDQQLGGLLLWVPGCIAFVVAGVVPVIRMLKPQDAPAVRTAL
jgi:putative membrane protein